MKSTPELVAECLAKAGVKSLLVGGLALEAHGYGRQTYDVESLCSKYGPPGIRERLGKLA